MGPKQVRNVLDSTMLATKNQGCDEKPFSISNKSSTRIQISAVSPFTQDSQSDCDFDPDQSATSLTPTTTTTYLPSQVLSRTTSGSSSRAPPLFSSLPLSLPRVNQLTEQHASETGQSRNACEYYLDPRSSSWRPPVDSTGPIKVPQSITQRASLSKRLKRALRGVFRKRHDKDQDIIYIEARHWTEL